MVGYLRFVYAVEDVFLNTLGERSKDNVDPWFEKRIRRWRDSETQRVNANERLQKKHERDHKTIRKRAGR